jgi:tetratricopeptide (TPR) repeat protein
MKKPDEELKRAITEASALADRTFPIPRELVFDDEPLEAILYGTVAPSATPASIFGSARRLIQRIQEAAQKADVRKTLSLATELKEHLVSEDVCRQLAYILKDMKLEGRSLYAAYPEPPRSDCPAEACFLAKWLGQQAAIQDDGELRLTVEELQYGAGLLPPTEAVITAWALQLITQLQELAGSGNLDGMLKLATQLMAAPHPVPVKALEGLLQVLRSLQEDGRPLIPTYPQPARTVRHPEVRLLLEWVWQEAGKCGNDELRLAVGTPLYRWSEVEQRYADARQVLQTMIEIYHSRHASHDEAICKANYAFEFAFERNWEEAIAHFEQVITRFKDLGDEVEMANTQANYWLCRVENEGLCEMDEMESQMKNAAASLAGNWRARKALFLLARVEEVRGNLSAALSLAERCLVIDKQFNSIYLDQDDQYIKKLQGKACSR